MMLLSLFPGIDLLGRAFEEVGFAVVRGPDVLWGGDIRRFHVPAGKFWGVIGGSPCQDFSRLRRSPATGYGLQMLSEFQRVVEEARPEWWLLENVPGVPDVKVEGYNWIRVDQNQGWYSGTNRLRIFQFGARSGVQLDLRAFPTRRGRLPAAVANDDRGFREVCKLQGLPASYDLPGFTVEQKVRAVGNGVPLVLGRVVARAIRACYGLDVWGEDPVFDQAPVAGRHCGCLCGRRVHGKQVYASAACRWRAKRRRDRVKAGS